MGIHPGGPKRATIYVRYFFGAHVDSMHKHIHCGAHGCLWVMRIEQEKIKRVCLSSGLCLESYT